MSFSSLVPLVAKDPAFDQVIGRTTSVLAIPEPAQAIAIAALAEASQRRPLLVAVPSVAEASRLAHDLRAFVGADEVDEFGAWQTLPFERVSPSVEVMGNRLRTLWQLQDPDNGAKILVAPVQALVQRLSPHVEDFEPVIVGVGDQVDQHELVAKLVNFGYRRETQVEHRGELAVRGSIVDVFGSTADAPVRIDLWGDEVERLCEFAVSDQRSLANLSEIELFPCRELMPTEEIRERADVLRASEPWGAEQWQRLSDGELFDGMESWLPWLCPEQRMLPDILHDDALVVLVDPTRMKSRAADIMDEEADLAKSLARTWNAVDDDSSVNFPQLHLPFEQLLARTSARAITINAVPDSPDVATIVASGWDQSNDQLVDRIRNLVDDGCRVLVAANGAGTATRLSEQLGEWGLNPTLHQQSNPGDEPSGKGLHVVVEPLERGFVLPDSKIAVLSESDVTGRRRTKRPRKPRKRTSEGFFADLKPGQHVVHYTHGVGKYAGMVKRAMGGHERDYLLLEYRGDDKLYLPSDQIDLIRPFTGGDSPSLHRLGGAEFGKAKAKVRSAVAEIAQELVVLYQRRLATEGHAFAPDTPWQAEVEAAFPYDLTPDQAETVIAIKQDMETARPMDRLVVGDVGFGKTEIALRAIFKAVQGGKQAALLAPTTLLAHQHYQTFTERFAPYPIRVEVLSRFLTAGQAKKIVDAIGTGDVDVVIGTHRILSQDTKFSDLGLLVVDEEQRFGVSHKETIKEFSAGVDVLTLTATPIPRTLEMSLTGIRDLSLLNTPPADRQPIMTYVGEYDERPVAEAIRRELLREGQVFFVHNRVRSIDKVANDIRNLVPEARVAIAHGQMDEGSLEKVVYDFWQGDYDVLVCTTIIESGIDMPTVNTLVVDRAELMGLGQLHQLRGRVGRSGQRAYAYLFTRPDARLSEDAYERLKTIGETTELGSGFKIAMRDLEIRGAGNLLGTGQSGHIASVGYDLYCQMVSEAVSELNGDSADSESSAAEIKIDLPVAANLADDYIPSEQQRLAAYRRLASVTTAEEVSDIEAEWKDRYGPVPDAAVRLLEVAGIRAHCVRTGVTELIVTKGSGFGGPEFVAKLGPLKMKVSQEVRFTRLFRHGVWKPAEYGESGGQLQVGLMKKKNVAEDLVTFFNTMFPEEE